MKRRDIILTVTLFTLVLIAFSGCFGAAWYNHSYSYSPIRGRVNTSRCETYAEARGLDPVDCYKQFYLAGDSAFYGTHDYISHFALDYVKNDDWSNKHAWLYNEQKKPFHAFLEGTEFPDQPDGVCPCQVILDCGKSTRAHLDFKTHSHTLRESIKRAGRYGFSAGSYLGRTDDDRNPTPWCETGALYIGAMAHYTAEMAHPGHASGLTYCHSWLEDQVARKTSLSDHNTNGENTFFEIDLAEKLGWSWFWNGIRDDLPPSNCVEQMAMITRDNFETDFYCVKGDGSYNATYLLDMGNDNDKFKFDDVNRTSAKYKPFFERVEILLNWAVYYTACAIKYCLKDFNGRYTGCTPGDEDEPEREYFPTGPWFPRDLADLLARYGPIIIVGIISYIGVKRTFGR